MAKLSLALAAAVVAVATVVTAQTLTARAQNIGKFEYLRATPYIQQTQQPNQTTFRFVGYEACIAATTDWRCRTFESKESSTIALREMLVTLGNDGWELLSAVSENPDQYPDRLTYFFKRQQR